MPAENMQEINGSKVEFRQFLFPDNAMLPDIKSLVLEYFLWGNSISVKEYGFNFDLSTMMETFLSELILYSLVDTRLYVLYNEGQEAIGIGGYKRNSENTAEIKRIYVRDGFRKKGLGRALVVKLVSEARAQGFEKLILESARFMTEAYSLYKSMGFSEIPNYPGIETHNEFLPMIFCMELNLKSGKEHQ